MNWDDLIAETAGRVGAGEPETARTLNCFLDLMIERMKTDDMIQLRSDFGYFEIKESGGAKSSHEKSLRKNYRTPVFKKSGILKKQLRQSDEKYVQMLQKAGRAHQAELIQRHQSVQKEK